MAATTAGLAGFTAVPAKAHAMAHIESAGAKQDGPAPR